MLRTITSKTPKASPEQIAAFENLWQIHLPGPYREFLLKHNGGEPVPAAFPVFGMPNNSFDEISIFLGLGAQIESEDLEWYFKNIFEKEIPQFLPIAKTSLGDYVCIDLSKPNNPIVLWDRTQMWGNNARFAFYFIAETFETFLSVIEEYPIN